MQDSIDGLRNRSVLQRPGRKGVMSTERGRPAIASAVNFPVTAAKLRPRWPWPKAKNALECPGAQPMTGNESGMEGRNDIQRIASLLLSGPRKGLTLSNNASARLGFGPAFRPANSTVPATRRPVSIGVTAMCRSTAKNGIWGRRATSGSTTMYPRSVSSGTCAPSAMASGPDQAPAAITNRSMT